MAKRQASLSDKFDLAETRQLLTGTQAIVRLMLMQKARDEAGGLQTAGYVSGYRGSPIASLESAFQRVDALMKSNDILFHPGLNEDLAATAVWGTQQAELRGEGKYDGVFSIWYGKGPGVDRSGDAFRHANHAGTSKHGGVLALMGDDHTCESSTSAHQSEFAFVDAMIPVLNPAGVQELLDFGLLGFALSRYAGVWVGLKCVKDNIESTATVDGNVARVAVTLPSDAEFRMPPEGLNIRRSDTALAKEARLHDYKRAAILAFARANTLDRIELSGGAQPKIGIITAGKSYLDTRQALDELGIDEVRAAALGLRLMKVAMTWPLEPRGIARFAKGLDLILVVEEKRSLIETQVKEQLFDTADRPRVLGKKDEAGQWLFPAKGALDPLDIAVTIGERLLAATEDAALAQRVAELKVMLAARPAGADAFPRTPHFCAGCPHNSSTVVPEGSRAYAGIGCHYMALWMDRETEGFTQMGAEGANWIGEAPFSNREHVFQNLGDGTYIHSGSLAIRAAVAAGVTMTFKLLYNDAVAMTGGQKLDGGISVGQMVAQVLAEGVTHVDVVTDEPDKYGPHAFPPGVGLHHRRDLAFVQRGLTKVSGVSVLIYDQTCAAEKRRRRKRGTALDPDVRVVINAAVCEGCGDCGVKSNCIAIQPFDTELGRKRTIDQSACNKDLSCLDGFCPSFVTLEGATVRRPALMPLSADGDRGDHLLTTLPSPALPDLRKPYAILVTGVGGTGVVTVSAVLAQAAHIAGKGFGSIDVTGLAQKGGAVACHMRIAERPQDIHAIRVGTAHADLVLGGDLVVTATNKILDAVRPGTTAVVYSTYELTTGTFARNPTHDVPGEQLRTAIESRTAGAPLFALDANTLAMSVFGDSIYANMLLLGFAYQQGLVPIGAGAIEEAITLNGVDVDRNCSAFRLGRLAAANPAALRRLQPPSPTPLREKPVGWDAITARRARHLAAYQDETLASRYTARVADIANLERDRTPGLSGLAEAVAEGYFKLLAYKDEYEVARLFTDGSFEATLAEGFDGKRRPTFHMAPPFLARRDKVTGHPRKMRFGPWLLPVLRLLAYGRLVRGTLIDPFGYTAERRQERRLISDYEDLLERITNSLSPQNHATCVSLASLPMEIRGFGHVKSASIIRVEQRRRQLMSQLAQTTQALQAAE